MYVCQEAALLMVHLSVYLLRKHNVVVVSLILVLCVCNT